MWKIILNYVGYSETLYFFTVNAAPPGAIVKHAKLLNLHFVYMGRNVCSNKWACVLVIVSNYIACDKAWRAFHRLLQMKTQGTEDIPLHRNTKTRRPAQINSQEERNAFR